MYGRMTLPFPLGSYIFYISSLRIEYVERVEIHPHDILLVFPSDFSYFGSKSYLKSQNPYISISAHLFAFYYVATIRNYPVTILPASKEVILEV